MIINGDINQSVQHSNTFDPIVAGSRTYVSPVYYNSQQPVTTVTNLDESQTRIVKRKSPLVTKSRINVIATEHCSRRYPQMGTEGNQTKSLGDRTRATLNQTGDKSTATVQCQQPQ